MAYILDETYMQEPFIDLEPASGGVKLVIRTLGNSCYSKGRLDIERDRGEVVVSPYNYLTVRRRGDTPNCISRGAPMVHGTTIRFDSARPWKITVRGRRAVAEDTVAYDYIVE